MAFRLELRRFFLPVEGMHRFFKSVIQKNGYQVKQIPVKHQARRHGKSKYGFGNRFFKTALDLLAASWLLRQQFSYKGRR
jgi:dolichol-phosphate mannosyltransferase